MMKSKVTFALVLGVGVFLYLYNDVFRAWMGHKTDFGTYYSASLCIRHRLNPYDSVVLESMRGQEKRYISEKFGGATEESSSPLLYIYPPLLAFALTPLTLFRYALAVKGWFVLNHLFLIGSAFLLWRSFWKERGFESLALVVFVTGIYFPAQFDLDLGQANLFVLLLIALAFYAGERGREAWSGALLGASASAKLTPLLLFVPLVLKRRLSAVLGGLAVVVVLQFLPAIFIGVRESLGWVGLLSQKASGAELASPTNQSLMGFLWRILGENPFTTSPLNSSELIKPLWLVGSGVLVGLTVIVLLRSEASDLIYQLALILPLILIVSPKSWEHHYVILLPAYLLLFSSESVGVMGIISFVLVGLEYQYYHPSLLEGWRVVFTSLKLLGAFLLYITLLRRLWKSTSR